MAQAGDHERNDTLNRETFGLAPLVSAGRLDFELTYEALRAAGRGVGLDEREVRATLKSALLGGIAKHPPTDFGALLDSVEAFIRRFVVFPSEHEPVALTLWVAHTWAIDAAQYTPYIVISSPEPESGKSRLLEELELLVPRPWRAVEPSEAVLYRRVDQLRPTLLLDECDAIFAVKDREPLRALLNEGFYRGAKVPRCVGQGTKMEVAEFAVLCPKALAGLGHRPDTVRTRQIPVSLRRKTPGEVVERFRARKLRAETGALRKQLQEWAEQHTEALTDVEPKLPDELSDRQQDVREPLFAIADAAGGSWPARARDAAKSLYRAAEPVQSPGVLLLEHIRDVFEVLEHRDAAGSEELIQALVMREGRSLGRVVGARSQG